MSVNEYNEIMEKIQPYSDEKMLYNEDTKQYELQAAWVKANFGNVFKDDAVLGQRIKRNTRKVYNYIFSRGYSGNRKTITAIINHTKEYREYIYDALFSQMESDCASGYNDQDLYVPKSKDDRELQQINEVSVNTENILKSSAGYGGINLLYAAAFNSMIYLEFWGYIK